MATIRVLIAEDHVVVREGLRMLLMQEKDIEVIGEAEHGELAVALTEKLRPDVVVMDISLPIMNGIEATRQIRKRCPSSRVLVLSSYADDELVTRLIDSGATGFLHKQSAATELVHAIRETKQGKAVFSQSIATRLAKLKRDAFNSGSQTKRRKPHLSSRETEVLQLISRGDPNKQIADVLGISIKTVEKHRQQVMDKLNIHDIAGLTRYAVCHGLVGTAPTAPPPC